VRLPACGRTSLQTQERKTTMSSAINALNDLNCALESVQPASARHRNRPYSDHPTALELIVGSVAAHYIGDMESDEDRYGAIWYRPSDEDDIREILADLWGKYLPAMIREKIAEDLIREGWPELFYRNYRDRMHDFYPDESA
jgi:hypothetical protein